MLIRWDDYLNLRERRAQAALDAADALLHGDSAPARAALGPWRFVGHTLFDEALCARILEDTPACRPEAVALSLRPLPGLDPGASTLRSEAAHREWLAAQLPASEEAVSSREAIAATLEGLGFWSQEVERRERAAWTEESYKIDPMRDAVAQGLWRRWFQGRFWEDQEDWERFLRGAVTRTIAGVVLERGVPRHRQAPLVRELRESLFMRLVGQDLLRRPLERRQSAEQLDGFLELAVRTLETAEPGPVDALAEIAGPEVWSWASRCPRARRSFAEALEVFGGPELPEPHARAERFRREAPEDPRLLEALLDLQVALRLVRAMEEGLDPWSVVTNNRGKARGRLRALLAQAEPAGLEGPLLALDALAARTLTAARRYAWAWARELLRHDLAVDALGGVTPPCEPPPPEVPAMSAEERRALATWTLLVALKGRLPQLLTWCTQGTSDKDTTWGRLLSDSLPEALRDPPQPGERQARYSRVRAELALGLDDWTQALVAPLEAVAAQSPGRDLGARTWAALEPAWDATVEFPSRGFPSLRRGAAESLEVLQRR
ncbi:MAG: hypothetical protein H6740_15295 [Alphaproteobacteria bacterium]|nr:hypothetical protein [Alphaproteobacteria bacterium]